MRRCARVAAALPPETTFLGFAGSPWTVATYMVAGQGSKDQARDAALRLCAIPRRFGAIIDAIVDCTVDYLSRQIEAGVEAVQLFDSWAGSLSPAQFERWVIAPNRADRRRAPGAPSRTCRSSAFPRARAASCPPMRAKPASMRSGSTRRSIRPGRMRVCPTELPVQGNLDPLALIAGGDALDAAIDRILAAFADRPHIFNLGHGILPDTPIAHVEQLLARVQEQSMIGFLGSCLSVGQGGACHLRDLLDGGAVHAAALSRLSSGGACRARPRPRRWIEREAQARAIILTPVDDPRLAARADAGGQCRPVRRRSRAGLAARQAAAGGAAPGYHGWAVGYAKKLARGRRRR